MTQNALARPKLKRRFLRMLVTLAAAYLLLCIAGCVFQRRLIYFPTKQDPHGVEQVAVQEGFKPWRNRNGEIIGWTIPAKGTSTGSVLVVHGNAGCALNRGYIARPINNAACLNVHVLEYPGYGSRAGSPRMKALLAAGEEAFDVIPKGKPIYLVSESIGAGVAAHLAKMHPAEVSGMLMFVPYDNLASVAQNKMPVLLPYLFLADRYNPAAWLREYRGPVKIVLAERDEIIPMKSGMNLFDDYQGPKLLEVFPGAGHNDVAEQSAEWWRGVLSFWTQNPTGRQSLESPAR